MTEHSSFPPPKKILFGETDFLAELAGEATQKNQVAASEEAARLARAEAVHTALQRLFNYLFRYVERVNQIRPELPRVYGESIEIIFDQLQWVDGFADCRKQSFADNALLDHVLLRIKVHNAVPMIIKRRWHQIPALRETLQRVGLHTVNDLDNLLRDQPNREFLTVELEADFLLHMHFQAITTLAC